ncbi:MAG: molybdopterin molybdotransferase MoeA [Acaryochloridaceae cyanobacterium SU_2_1]|nr:molybdopterin molybdotransferase MoeA [Acaryochloridaceae cyanobacterium SU_2_1]
MLSTQDAESLILQSIQPLNSRRDQDLVPLRNAHQRILATAITSALDFPYWDNSAMDGYALRYQDIQGCSPEYPAVLEVVTEIQAGSCPRLSVGSQQAARIFTGAMMPLGADTVVMQEDTNRQGNQVQVCHCPTLGAYVRRQGAYYQAGTPVLGQGTVLRAPEIAILATMQCTTVPVFRRPVVTILSTGNELIAPDQPLQPGQIIDSNRYALAALVETTGAEARLLEIVGDQPEDLKAAMAGAIATSDLVLSTGGVSVGDYDYVDQILTELEAEILIAAVAIKPGKPLTFARTAQLVDGLRPVWYFGLPGNPVSALVSFWRFVQPALRKLAGQSRDWGPSFVAAQSAQALPAAGPRETYLWGQLSLKEGRYQFSLADGSHSSGNLINLAQTNGLAVLPCHSPTLAINETVQVMKVGSVGDINRPL